MEDQHQFKSRVLAISYGLAILLWSWEICLWIKIKRRNSKCLLYVFEGYFCRVFRVIFDVCFGVLITKGFEWESEVVEV